MALLMRRFRLVRDHDVTGISGTGVVAEGVAFTDGVTVVRWLRIDGGVRPTTVVHPDAANVLELHGHGGSTRIDWLDR